MAGSLNRVTIIGNVGADPEIRHTQQSVPIANFSVATSEEWKDRNTGEKKEKTEWHRVVVFGRHDGDSLATIVEKYVKKGTKVMVEGALQTRKWTDQAGIERYSTEIVLKGFDAKLLLLGDSSGSGGNRPPPPNGPEDYGRPASSRPSANRPEQTGGYSGGGDMDDDIPFFMEWR